jgi:hypothetical protein
VEEGPAGLASVAVVDADGARLLVRLKDPLIGPVRWPGRMMGVR